MAETGLEPPVAERTGRTRTPRARWLDLVIVVVVVSGLLVGLAIAAAPPGGLITCVRCDGKPVVTMALNATSATGADILIASAQPLQPPSKFLLNLQVGSVFGSAKWLTNSSGAPLAIRVNASTYLLAWHDADSSRTVSPGDDVSVTYPTGAAPPAAGTSLVLYLIWSDGSTIVTRSWTV